MQETDHKMIRNRYRALLRALGSPLPPAELKRIRNALNLLVGCLDGKTTITGQSAVEHALSVARIVVSEIGLGVTSAVASLLHDCTRELPVGKSEIVKMFGRSAASVIEGLGKVESINTLASSYQAENFLKLILSMADDIRVLLIKLVERLEYMRRLDGAEPSVTMAVASESYFLYAPLAHRLGLYNVKSELEDLAMKYLDTEAYNMIVEKLRQTTASRNRFIREFSAPVRDILSGHNFKYTIKSRTKSIHSIWQKMKNQRVEFEEVYDIFAIRIILDSKPENEKADCWQVYSLVTDIYQPNPSRMRDWISVPKSNGYESLHTTVIGPRGKWVEVQIRTSRMDEIAEKGLAAHHRYKGIKGESGLDEWLVHMREILESGSEEDKSVIDSVKSGLYTDEVFVFTPKGDLKRLKQGATVLDFAFEIHTQVGSACVGGKVNGRNVPIKHVLANGDRVSVLTSRNQKPKSDWLSFAVTSKARSRIRQALSDEKLKDAADGREMLMRRLKNWKIEYNDALVRSLIDHYKMPAARDLYYQIFHEKIDLLDIKEFIRRRREKDGETDTKEDLQSPARHENAPKTETEGDSSDYLVIENSVEGLDYRLSPCCNPVFGDRVFGFVTITEGIKIHRTNCPNAPFLMANYPYRIVPARWTEKREESASFRTSVRVTGVNDLGVITRIHEMLASYRITLRNFNYENRDGMFEGIIDIYVPNVNTLNGLIKNIQSIKGVVRAARYEK